MLSLAREPLVPSPRPSPIPLGAEQRRLWFLSRLTGWSSLYHESLAIRFHSACDREALRGAIGDLVRRHEILRTIFPESNGEIRQVILDFDPACATLEIVQSSRSELSRHVREARQRPLDLTVQPPFAAYLFDIASDFHLLVLVLHHIAVDGWSIDHILVPELTAAYRARCGGGTAEAPTAPFQYADYAIWQQRALDDDGDADGTMARQLSYWKRTLADLPDELSLPVDYPRPATASFRGSVIPVLIDQPVHVPLIRLAQRARVSVFMVLQAAFAALLTRLGAGTDIPIGCPISTRSTVALRHVVGLFVNTVVLRIDTSGDPSFDELLQRVRRRVLEARANGDIPFERIVEELRPRRSLTRNPLFQVLIGFQRTQTNPRPDTRPAFERVGTPGEGQARFDLSLDFIERHSSTRAPIGIAGSLRYSLDLFRPETAQAIATRYAALLRAVAEDSALRIGQIDLLSRDEHQALRHWTALRTCGDARSIVSRIEAQAALRPEAAAVTCGNEAWSYADLNAAANRLARRLSARGFGANQIVGVAMERSASLALAELGVLKSGAAFLPLDVTLPPPRLALLLAEAGAACVVTTRAVASRLPATVPAMAIDDPTTAAAVAALSGDDLRDDERRQPLHPSQAAYVLFTSGSTGRPKGVVVSHRALAAFLDGFADVVPFQPGDRHLAVTSPGFDIHIVEILVPLCSGAETVIAEEPATRDLAALSDLVRTTQPTSMQATPSLWRLLVAAPWPELSRIRVLVGGEALSPELAAALTARSRSVINLYGPTEATIWASAHPVRDVALQESQTSIPIGWPLQNYAMHVLDTSLVPVPPGVSGELYIAGDGLARGYLADAAATAASFVANPFSAGGERMYRTGDWVRWRADGTLTFIGRKDEQLKIRGVRVELGEIAATLRRHSRVQDAVAIADDARERTRIIGYVIAREAADQADPLLPQELKVHVRRHLPDVMVPDVIVSVAAWPLTSSGKLDRRALPKPSPEGRDTVDRVPSPHEAVVCAIFGEVLGVEAVGVHDDFFELGGHSLLATMVMNRVQREWPVELDLRVLFDAATPARLAQRIEESLRSTCEQPLA